MIIADVNVLIAAMVTNMPQHPIARQWLEQTLESDEAFGTWEPILAAVMRITTQPGFGVIQLQPQNVRSFVNAIRTSPHHESIRPTADLWDTFCQLQADTNRAGKHCSDLLLAALAIDQNAVFYTFDSDFQLLPRVRVRRPS